MGILIHVAQHHAAAARNGKEALGVVELGVTNGDLGDLQRIRRYLFAVRGDQQDVQIILVERQIVETVDVVGVKPEAQQVFVARNKLLARGNVGPFAVHLVPPRGINAGEFQLDGLREPDAVRRDLFARHGSRHVQKRDLRHLGSGQRGMRCQAVHVEVHHNGLVVKDGQFGLIEVHLAAVNVVQFVRGLLCGGLKAGTVGKVEAEDVVFIRLESIAAGQHFNGFGGLIVAVPRAVVVQKLDPVVFQRKGGGARLLALAGLRYAGERDAVDDVGFRHGVFEPEHADILAVGQAPVAPHAHGVAVVVRLHVPVAEHLGVEYDLIEVHPYAHVDIDLIAGLGHLFAVIGYHFAVDGVLEEHLFAVAAFKRDIGIQRRTGLGDVHILHAVALAVVRFGAGKADPHADRVVRPFAGTELFDIQVVGRNGLARKAHERYVDIFKFLREAVAFVRAELQVVIIHVAYLHRARGAVDVIVPAVAPARVAVGTHGREGGPLGDKAHVLIGQAYVFNGDIFDEPGHGVFKLAAVGVGTHLQEIGGGAAFAVRFAAGNVVPYRIGSFGIDGVGAVDLQIHHDANGIALADGGDLLAVFGVIDLRNRDHVGPRGGGGIQRDAGARLVKVFDHDLFEGGLHVFILNNVTVQHARFAVHGAGDLAAEISERDAQCAEVYDQRFGFGPNDARVAVGEIFNHVRPRAGGAAAVLPLIGSRIVVGVHGEGAGGVGAVAVHILGLLGDLGIGTRHRIEEYHTGLHIVIVDIFRQFGQHGARRAGEAVFLREVIQALGHHGDRGHIFNVVIRGLVGHVGAGAVIDHFVPFHGSNVIGSVERRNHLIAVSHGEGVDLAHILLAHFLGDGAVFGDHVVILHVADLGIVAVAGEAADAALVVGFL